MAKFATFLRTQWDRLRGRPTVVDSRLALAIEGANDALWDWDLRTNKIHYAARWSESLGYALDELGDDADRWASTIHPDDAEPLNRVLMEHLDGRTPFYQFEFRLRAKDGSYRWIFGRGVCERDKSGKPIRVAGSLTDITRRKLTEAALSESERRYRSLFEATIEVILIHKDGIIIDVNNAFEQVLGYSCAEAIGMSALEIAAPESKEKVLHCIETNFIGMYEAVALCKDGSTLPVEVNVKMMEFEGKEVRVTALRDITERVRMVEAERERRELAEALLDAARALGQTLDLNGVLDNLMSNLGRVVPHQAADVMLIEGNTVNVLRASGRASTNLPDWLLVQHYTIHDLPNLRHVIESRQPVIIRDTQTDPNWLYLDETAWIRSHLSAPIIVDGGVIGLINLCSDQTDAFNERDAQNLLIFAASAGFALKNARLFEQETRAKQQTQSLLNAIRALSSMTELEPLLNTILEQAGQVVPYVTGSIGIIRNGRFEFKALAGYDDNQKKIIAEIQDSLTESPILHQILAMQKPIIIQDVTKHDGWEVRAEVPHIRSWMGLPLLVRNRVMGVLSLDGDQAGVFSSEHLAIAEAFASNAAIAIARVELLEAERQARQRAQALLKANRVLSSTLSLEEVLEKILQECATVLPYTQGAIIADSDGFPPIISASGYKDADTTELVRYLKKDFRSSDLFRYMREHPHPMMLADVRDFDGWRNMPGREAIQGWIGLPLMVWDVLVGLLIVCSEQVDAYDEGHTEIARAFADQAALAIHNAQLYQAEQMERVFAETLLKTSQALASSLDLDSTLRLIVELLGDVVEYDTSAVALIEDDHLRLLAARGLPDDLVRMLGQRMESSELPLAEAIRAGMPLLLEDARADPRWNTPVGERAPRGWIGVPLMAYGKSVGLLTVGSDQPAKYSQRDLKAVSAFGNQAAIAIENARLLRELEDSVDNLRAAQSQLVQSARLSAAGEVSLGVAHQINNPLTIIIAEAHLMRHYVTDDSPLIESVNAINEAARQAGTVVQRMLDFSRTRPTEVQAIDVNGSLNKTIFLFRAQLESHITLNTNLDKSLPMAQGSEEHLSEVWLNLLLNARDALEHTNPGIITITSTLASDEQMIEVRLSDNGPGMSEQIRERIFEPFFTTKVQGTGLGLALSKDYLTAQGGSLEVETIAGQGTVFVIRLPVLPMEESHLHENSDFPT